MKLKLFQEFYTRKNLTVSESLEKKKKQTAGSGSTFTNHSQEHSSALLHHFVNLNVTQLLIG